MSMTIKELADTLGVSKTAIRNHIDENFRSNHMESTAKGVFVIDPDGCKVVAALMGRLDKLPQYSEKKFAETPETSENITIPRSVLQLMEDQLREKDEQLKVRDQQIADLTAAVKAHAQSINAASQNTLAGTMKQLTDGTPRKRWQFWKKEE